MRAKLRTILAAALFVGLIPCVRYLELELQAREQENPISIVEAYSLPPVGLIKALSFGYNELAADLLWIRAIGYYADHLLGDRDLRHLERYLNTIVSLDERFPAVYRYGPAMLLGNRERTQVMAAIRLLKRGVAVYPEEWRYPFFLGAYYMSELRSTSPQERAANRREGADWIRRAALLGADSSWLPALAASIYTEQGQRDLAIRHLQELFVTTQDPDMKVQIAGKLKNLQAAKYLDDARAAAEATTRARDERGLSFVPVDLFALIWLPLEEPFSLRRLVEGKAEVSPR